MKTQWAKVARSVAATLLGLAPVAPELVAKLGVSTTAGVGAGILAVAGAVTRVMQIPTVDAKVDAWLHVNKETTA